MSKDTASLDLDDNYTAKDIFLDQQNLCCLCLNELHFEHQLDYAQNSLKETACCQHCGVKVWEHSHSMH